jgi:hypothetical protein
MDLQHCIACSGVVVAPQSNAYAERASASAATRIGFAKRIVSRLGVFLAEVNGLQVNWNPLTKFGEEAKDARTNTLRG